MTKEEFKEFAEHLLSDADCQLSYAKSSVGEELTEEVRQHDPHLADLMTANVSSIERIVDHIASRLG